MNQLKKMSIFLITALLAGSLASCNGAGANNAETTFFDPSSVGQAPTFDYRINVNTYINAINAQEAPGGAYLLLANKSHPLGKDYTPSAMTQLKSNLTAGNKEIILEYDAALAAEALMLELHARGYTDILVTSGYRSYARQEWLFNYYTEDEMRKDPSLTRAQSENIVLTYSARAGTSEHQTGLCIDLISNYSTSLDESFALNPAYSWLVENAHNFGFILRYPQDKENITGYKYEPWHYRFVGRQAAYEMWKNGLTLEEYLAYKN